MKRDLELKLNKRWGGDWESMIEHYASKWAQFRNEGDSIMLKDFKKMTDILLKNFVPQTEVKEFVEHLKSEYGYHFKVA